MDGTTAGDELIDLANDAIIVRDLATATILRWNRAAERLYGWTAAEALGKTTHALLKTRFPVPFMDIQSILRARGLWSGELIHHTRDGRQVTVESRWSLWEGRRGDPPSLLEINTDITERKRAEQTLVHTEAYLRNMLESAPDAIVSVDRSGRIVFVNSQATQVFGYGRAELLDMSIDMLVPEQYRAQHAAHRAGYHLNPRLRPMGAGLELYGQRKDGTTFPVEISLSPFVSEGDTLVTAVVRDISERKRAESERMRAEAAEQAVRQRDEFLSVAAHELKTPLTSLLGFAEALDRLYERGREPEIALVRRALQTIARQSEKLNALVNQLLDASRIEAGRLRLDRKQTDLVPIVRGVAQDAQARTTAHTLLVRAPESMAGTVDSLRLEQVITNLVDNAIKYSPDGGQIVVTGSCDAGRWARISVRDHGIGIPQEERAHIFDRYYQAHSRMHRSGMGLGLYISHQIVELHGGKMEVAFPSDGGSEFTVLLPLDVEA